MPIKTFMAIFVLAAAFTFTACLGKKKNDSDVKLLESKTVTDNIVETDTVANSEFKTFELDFGFKVTIGKEEDFERFKTYTYFKLERNNNIVYLENDSSLIEYEFGNTLFPIILQTGDNSFELLFEINDRPSKNYLKRLFVSNDKLTGQDELPTFEAKPIDINGDGIKEYAGYRYDSQYWGRNDSLTTYSPILYYSATKEGLKLDSSLTKQRNEIIYGQFYGYSYSEKYEIPISVIDKFEQELKVIRGTAK
ncbi:MAG: hypothetical protein LBH25_02350 [Fibromonadaceae bacterium]|jgi:hypothetical protein|nr:hypothetical protein [Fibromonadaceae bacterium]